MPDKGERERRLRELVDRVDRFTADANDQNCEAPADDDDYPRTMGELEAQAEEGESEVAAANRRSAFWDHWYPRQMPDPYPAGANHGSAVHSLPLTHQILPSGPVRSGPYGVGSGYKGTVRIGAMPVYDPPIDLFDRSRLLCINHIGGVILPPLFVRATRVDTYLAAVEAVKRCLRVNRTHSAFERFFHLPAGVAEPNTRHARSRARPGPTRAFPPPSRAAHGPGNRRDKHETRRGPGGWSSR